MKDENLTSFGIDKYGKSCLPYHKLYKDFKNLIVFPQVFYNFSIIFFYIWKNEDENSKKI